MNCRGCHWCQGWWYCPGHNVRTERCQWEVPLCIQSTSSYYFFFPFALVRAGSFSVVRCNIVPDLVASSCRGFRGLPEGFRSGEWGQGVGCRHRALFFSMWCRQLFYLYCSYFIYIIHAITIYCERRISGNNGGKLGE